MNKFVSLFLFSSLLLSGPFAHARVANWTEMLECHDGLLAEARNPAYTSTDTGLMVVPLEWAIPRSSRSGTPVRGIGLVANGQVYTFNISEDMVAPMTGAGDFRGQRCYAVQMPGTGNEVRVQISVNRAGSVTVKTGENHCPTVAGNINLNAGNVEAAPNAAFEVRHASRAPATPESTLQLDRVSMATENYARLRIAGEMINSDDANGDNERPQALTNGVTANSRAGVKARKRRVLVNCAQSLPLRIEAFNEADARFSSAILAGLTAIGEAPAPAASVWTSPDGRTTVNNVIVGGSVR